MIQLDLKLDEYISGHNDFDGQTKLHGHIEVLKYVLELNQYCLKCEHHEVNHALCGVGYCLICEPDFVIAKALVENPLLMIHGFMVYLQMLMLRSLFGMVQPNISFGHL
jgi:hypothetical protein